MNQRNSDIGDIRDQESAEKIISALFLVAAISSFIIFFFIRDLHARANLSLARMKNLDSWSVIRDFTGKKPVITLDLPERVTEKEIKTRVSIAEKTVKITIPGLDAGYPRDYSMTGKIDRIRDIKYSFGKRSGTFTFYLSTAMEPRINIKGKKAEINFYEPRSLYRRIILLDAGLGGEEKGVSFDGTNEADVNLSIMKEVKKILDDKLPDDVKIYTTRNSNETVSDAKRLTLVGDSECDTFISVRMNSTSSGRTSTMNGAAVLYLSTNEKSHSLADMIRSSLVQETGAGNRGLIPGDSDPFMEHLGVPSVIVKPGYVTNIEERNKFTKSDYRKKTAKAIADAVINYIEGDQQ